MLREVSHGNPLRRPVHSKSSGKSPCCVGDRNCNRDHAFHELLSIKRESVGSYGPKFQKQSFGIRVRCRRQLLESQCVDETPALLVSKAGNEAFAACRAMEGHMGSDGQLDAKRPIGFNPVYVAHSIVFRDDEIDCFPNLPRHIHENLAAGDMGARTMKNSGCDFPQPP